MDDKKRNKQVHKGEREREPKSSWYKTRKCRFQEEEYKRLKNSY